MKYTALMLTFLIASHGFAMQKGQTPTPASTAPATAATPLIQRSGSSSKSSIIVAITSGVSPANLLKKLLYDRIGQQ